MALPDARGHFAALGDKEAEEVYRKIYESILGHQLPPGTKLPEEKLATIFKVTRAKVRKVLTRLEHERIIESFPNRGAYVARPTPEESADILEARRIIEPAIAEKLAHRTRTADVARLREHIEAEYDASRRQDHQTMVRLAGEFHNVMAALVENGALARMVRDFAALTCLTIILYDAPTAGVCLPDEHVQLTDAIENGDAAAAAQIMVRHLQALEDSLLFEKPGDEIDLEALFSRAHQ